MKTLTHSLTLSIPKGLTLEVNTRVVTVTNSKGEKLVKDFRHLNMDMSVAKGSQGGQVFECKVYMATKKDIATVRTVISHVKNMVVGLTKGFLYKMRLVYAHFPINVTLADDAKSIEIRNFIGQRVVRKIDMLEGVTIVKSENVKDELILKGNNLENVAQSAADIQMACTVKKKDIRKFLDGIYVSERTNIIED
eukprot:TRINITY_DN10853_c0_g1_i3.p1 TRINITY_DN10853_c0_g1~~TRINITY_DN10853_c0_g1_i3.p1  ORF type:complete len:194 (-),score=33.88 TRINITY_DN10853_c0_g1_i3:47-628(-)